MAKSEQLNILVIFKDILVVARRDTVIDRLAFLSCARRLSLRPSSLIEAPEILQARSEGDRYGQLNRRFNSPSS
jgi:hypothetical protein